MLPLGLGVPIGAALAAFAVAGLAWGHSITAEMIMQGARPIVRSEAPDGSGLLPPSLFA